MADEPQNPFDSLQPDQRKSVSDQVVAAFKTGKLSPAEITDLRQVQKWLVESGGKKAEAAQKAQRSSPKLTDPTTWTNWNDKMMPDEGIAPGFVRGVKGAVDFGVGAVTHPIDTATGIVKAQGETLEKGKKAGEEGKYGEALAYGTYAAIPLMGPWLAQLGERMQKGDVSGATTELVTGLAIGKVTPEAWAATKPHIVRALRESASKEAGRLLGSKEGGIGISEQNMVGTRVGEMIPKVRTQIDALRQNVKKGVEYYEKQGRTIDVQDQIRNIIGPEAQRLMASGGKKATAMLSDALDIYHDVAYERNAGGAAPGAGYRLHRMKPSELVDVAHNIGNAAYEGGAGQLYKDLARRVRHELADGLGQLNPNLAKMQSRIHQLLEAESRLKDMERSSYEKAKTLAWHWLASNDLTDAAAMLGAYYVIREGIGQFVPEAGWAGTMATMAAIRTVMKSVPVTTVKAAMKQRLADLIESRSTIVKPVAWPVGGTGAQPAAAPAASPPQPQPQAAPPPQPPAPATTPPQAQAAAAPGGAPGSSPQLPPAVQGPAGPTGAPTGAAPPALPPPAPRPAATQITPSVDLTKLVGPESDKVRAVFQELKKKYGESIPEDTILKMAVGRVETAVGKKIETAAPAPTAAAKPVGKPFTKKTETPEAKPQTASEQASAILKAVGEAAKPAEAPAAPPAAPTKVKKIINGVEREVTVAPEGASGVSTLAKTAFDQIDRANEASSALARAKAKQVLDDFEALSRVDLTPEQRSELVSDLTRKTSQRERKRAQRERDSTQKPEASGAVAEGAAGGEVNAATGKRSAEARAATMDIDGLLDGVKTAYAEIAKLDGGKEAVKLLKEHSKALGDPKLVFQEALETLEALKGLSEISQ